MTVKPIPEGYHTVTPYLTVQGAARLIDFLKQAFDAQEAFRMAQPDGTIGHAELRIGDSIVMMADAPTEWGPMPGTIHLYVNDTDATYKRALQAGATSLTVPRCRHSAGVSRRCACREGSGIQDQAGSTVE